MKKILVPILAVSMVLLTACSSSSATSTATVSPEASESVSTTITVDNDNSTYSYVEDENTDAGYNISNSIITPNNLIVADDNYLYYVKKGSDGLTHLYRSDKDGKNETMLIDNCGGNLNLVNGYIVYSGQSLYDIYKYNISTKKITRIFYGVYESIYAANNVLYMSNSLNGIVSCDLNGNNYQIISKTNSYIAGYYNGYLYYSYSDSTTGATVLNKVKIGETTSTVVLDDSTLTPLIVKGGDVLCLTSDSATSSYVFELYSLDESKVTDTVLSFDPNTYGLNSIAMSKGTIYFSFVEEETATPTATADATATVDPTATAATEEVNNLYVYDIASKKTYKLGKTTNVLMMLAGKYLYTIDGDTDSSYKYIDITTLTRLDISGNSVKETDIFTP